jgi:hypothetical protein
MNIIHNNVSGFFEELLIDLDCHQDTRAYIVGIFGSYKSANYDFSKQSITTLFSQAREKHSFADYQRLADWLFFVASIAPDSLKYASKDYYNTIGRLSYYSCYKLINKEWKLYEELSDNWKNLESQVHSRLTNIVI